MPASAPALRYQSAIPYTLRHARTVGTQPATQARSQRVALRSPSVSFCCSKEPASTALLAAMRKASIGGHVIGVPVTSKAYGIEEASRDPSFRKGDGDHLAVSLTHPSPYASFGYKHSSKGQVIHWVSKLSRRAQGFREHVTLGPKLSETVKGKLSLGARILKAGGVERVFRQAFSAEKGERLVKALQCYIYTTGGPIAGMLFVSTKKVAFRSDRPITVTSPKGDAAARVTYKVVIPLRRIDKVRPSENVDRPEEKYIYVATVDGFEFWFMGFVSYQRSCKYMQQAISELQ